MLGAYIYGLAQEYRPPDYNKPFYWDMQNELMGLCIEKPLAGVERCIHKLLADGRSPHQTKFMASVLGAGPLRGGLRKGSIKNILSFIKYLIGFGFCSTLCSKPDDWFCATWADKEPAVRNVNPGSINSHLIIVTIEIVADLVHDLRFIIDFIIVPSNWILRQRINKF